MLIMQMILTGETMKELDQMAINGWKRLRIRKLMLVIILVENLLLALM